MLRLHRRPQRGALGLRAGPPLPQRRPLLGPPVEDAQRRDATVGRRGQDGRRRRRSGRHPLVRQRLIQNSQIRFAQSSRLQLKQKKTKQNKTKQNTTQQTKKREPTLSPPSTDASSHTHTHTHTHTHAHNFCLLHTISIITMFYRVLLRHAHPHHHRRFIPRPRPLPMDPQSICCRFLSRVCF